MRVFLVFAVLSFILSACGRAPSIDPEIYPYVQAFMAAGNLKSIPPIDIQFGTPDTEAEGECRVGLSGAKIVIVKPDWDSAVHNERLLLVFHELGHCVLGRVHNNALDTNGTPVSIMHSNISVELILGYMHSPSAYVHELFSTK